MNSRLCGKKRKRFLTEREKITIAKSNPWRSEAARLRSFSDYEKRVENSVLKHPDANYLARIGFRSYGNLMIKCGFCNFIGEALPGENPGVDHFKSKPRCPLFDMDYGFNISIDRELFMKDITIILMDETSSEDDDDSEEFYESEKEEDETLEKKNT